MSERSDEFLACYPSEYGRIYSARKPDHSKCCARVYDSHARASYQCKRANGSGPHGAYCSQHDPKKIAAKSADRMAKWAQDAKLSRLRREFITDCQNAIRDIAAGHNDPRGLAQSLIDKLNGAA